MTTLFHVRRREQRSTYAYDSCGFRIYAYDGTPQMFGWTRGPDGAECCGFAGYFRDAETGLDYAKNRYHQPGMGRFLTPDPYMAKAGGAQDPANPGSWNQYAYVQGDPINGTDRPGLYVDYDGGDDTDYGGNGSSCFASKSDNVEVDCDNEAPGGDGSDDSSDDDEESPWQCPTKYQNWINANGAAATSVASSVGTTEANILGISALESGWGTGPFVQGGRNDYFNLEKTKTKKNPNPTPLPFSTGWAPASGSNQLVATYSSYLNSAKSFAAVENKIINGVTDPTTFATNLQTLGKFGIGPNGPNPKFVSDVVSIINLLNKCLNAQ